MPQFRDYYEILGVSKTATPDEIRTSFRKLARKYHPDVAKDKKAAEEKFKEINEAYEVLGDEEKRRKYDEFGANWQANGMPGGFPGGSDGGFAGGFPGGFPQGGTWHHAGGAGNGGVEFEFGGTGFSDFFEHLFGARRSQHGGGGFAGSKAASRGQDIESDILVTLEEAFHGATRQISFRRNPRAKMETYTVKIPKGVRQGQRIRLAGVGSQGARGGGAGDLYLRVKYERHPDYEISGSDLIHRVEIPAWDAVLGCTIEVPTLEGRVRLKIPEGSRNEQRFRLAGRGLPNEDGKRGNYYAIIEVTLPRKPLSQTEREHWQKIAAMHR